MNKNKYLKYSAILALAAGLIAAASYVVMPHTANAQAVGGDQVNVQPNIQTYSTATSSTVVITSPSGYKSQVISSYDGNQFHTYATSTPLTATDMQNIQSDFEKQQAAMNAFFEQEQTFFANQQQMFQNLWSGISF